jgi:hypothetical protein
VGIVFTPISDHAKSIRAEGDLLRMLGTLTFSGSYATGGEVPSVSTGGNGLKQMFRQIGMGEVLMVSDVRGNSAEYDNLNDKLKLFGAANTEVAAAAYNAALTASPVTVEVVGR